MLNPIRKLKLVKNINDANLVTHGGTFHCDEVMATAILLRAIPGDNELTLFRNSGNSPIPKIPGQVVYDVGLGEFDHHQRGGNGARPNGIPYAACGLVWREYGRLLMRGSSAEIPEEAFNRIDRELIQPIDAQDCGYRNPFPDDYSPTPTYTLSNAITALNPTWNEEESFYPSDNGFLTAVNIASIILERVIEKAISRAEAKSRVHEYIMSSEGGIMLLPYYVPWEEFIFPADTAPEELKAKAAEILYVVYPGNRGGHQFKVVPDKPGSFGQRNSVPDSWKGLKMEDLVRVTGVETATFVHPAGFIGGAESLDDCLKLARKAIAEGTRNA